MTRRSCEAVPGCTHDSPRCRRRRRVRRAGSRRARPPSSRRSPGRCSTCSTGRCGVSPWPGPRRFLSLNWTWAMWPLARNRASTSCTGSDLGLRRGADVEHGAQRGRCRCASTSAAACATVLITGVSVGRQRLDAIHHAGLLRVRRQLRPVRLSARAVASATLWPACGERCLGEPCTSTCGAAGGGEVDQAAQQVQRARAQRRRPC